MTTFTSVANFLPLVMPWVQGAPQMGIRAEIVRSAVRFCDLTGVWTENADPINVVAATHTYAITNPVSVTNAQPVMVKQAKYDGDKLNPTTPAELATLSADWQDTTGTPTKFYQISQATIRLYPIPETGDALTDGLELYVTYKPTLSATTVPDFLLNHYGFGIAAGAISALLSMPGRSWTNLDLAAYYAKKFAAEVTSARIAADTAFCPSVTRVTTRFV